MPPHGTGRMTDAQGRTGLSEGQDSHYQPWLRGTDVGAAPDRARGGSAGAPSDGVTGGGLAKPVDPPLGLDISAYPARDDAPTRPQIVKRGPSAPPLGDRMLRQTQQWAQRLAQGTRSGAARFATWTIDLGARADVPRRVAELELPRRAGEGWALLRHTAGRMAQGASAGTARAWDAARLADRSAAAAERAAEVVRAAKARTGALIDQRRAPAGEAALPPSGLDRLLAEGDAAPPPAADAAPADLPLFRAPVAAEPAAPVPAPVGAAGSDAAATPPPAPKAEVPRSESVKTPATPGSGTPPPRGPRDTGAAPSLPRWWWIAALAALALTFWAGARIGSGAMDKAAVEKVVRDYILANPSIIPEAMEKHRANQMAAAINAIRPALERPYAGAWAGNANGDVTVVIFTDYGCGYCKLSVPDVDRLIREDGKVKVVFRELPIIAPQSRDAALMALRAARQGKYDAFHHAMFAAGSLDAAAIAAAAAKAGVVTDGSADATASDAALARELDSNLAIAQQLQLNATPTWIIGNELVQGAIGYDGLKAAVGRARRGT